MNCIPEALNLVITSALLLGTTSQALPKRLFMLDCETGQAAKALSAEWMFLDSTEQVWLERKKSGGPFRFYLVEGGGDKVTLGAIFCVLGCYW